MERSRCAAVPLPDGALWIPGALAGELAAALRSTCSPAAPSSARQFRPSRALMALGDAAAAAAVEHQAAKHRAAAAATVAAAAAHPSPNIRPLLPCDQDAETSGLVTTAEAADRLGLTVERVRQLAAAGRIAGRRTSRRVWLLESESVTAYVPRRLRRTTSADRSRA